jgi:signal transduction histidine kinase
MAWGTHVCQFYETGRDLIDIVVPYYRAGLERRHFCLWVLPEPDDIEHATRALRRAIPEADRHLAAGDIEILDHNFWQHGDGTFDGRQISDAYAEKLDDALARGYAGMRVSATPKDAWLAADTWPTFNEFEHGMSAAIASQRMIVLCTYPLDATASGRVFDVAQSHQAAMARRTGRWEVIEVLEVAEARAAVRQQKEELEAHVAQRTHELATAYDALRRETAERERTESALRASEEQLRRAQKLEALGQLAGGIAHDFNNLLMVIRGNLDIMSEDLPPDHTVQTDLAEIRSATERTRTLVRQLLAFSRKQVLAVQRLDVNDVVRDGERLLRRVIGEEIALHVSAAPEPLLVEADAGQLEQVLLNLAINARDAMLTPLHGHPGTGGSLTVETDAVSLALADVAARDSLPPGNYVRLTVRDTGHGMDAETVRHVFEPFFTTKPVGQGTGLGLATAFGIVTQSGGSIRVQTAPGAGTTFVILLPRVEPAGVDAAAGLGAASGVGAGDGASAHGTILLVEDEAAVRASARRLLERRGYSVLEARHGADALLIWRQYRDAIIAVVTDLRMPELGGPEFVALLRAEAPTLPVVYVSGYAEHQGIHVLRPNEAFLEKPFTGDALLGALARVVDVSRRGT